MNLLINGTRLFTSAIREDIKVLYRTEIGSSLFHRIEKTVRPITIAEGVDTRCVETPENSKIFINLEKHHSFSTVNDLGVRSIFTLPRFITLAHELIHHLHVREEGAMHFSDYRVLPGFPNVEEQYTVTGKKPKRYHQRYPKGAQVNDLSEHAFCEAYACPKRDVYALSKSLLEEIDEKDVLNGCTRLHYAAAKGDLPLVKKLLHSGARIDAQNFRQATPLMLAVQQGETEVVRYLIKRGANPRISDVRSFRPIDDARSDGDEIIANLVQ